MLQLTITINEKFNEDTSEFITETETVELEHSLLSLSKWESKHKKPFLADDEKTDEEILDYIRCMYVDGDFPERLFSKLNVDNFAEINDYMSDSQTATWFNDQQRKPSREKVTAELIYYWMFSNQIPKDCERWHLGRLLTLIRVFSAKNEPPKKMSQAEIQAKNRELNEKRKKQLKTSG